MRCASVLFSAATLVGCQSCSSRAGLPGAPPVEQRSPPDAPVRPDGPVPPDAPAQTSLPDPCRGLALPEDQHYVAPGLCARAVATRQGELRQISFAPNGDLFGVVTDGTIKRYHDANGDGVYTPDEVSVWARTGGHNGNNCHIDEGYLYAGSPAGVKRWRWGPEMLAGGESEDVVVGEPSTGHPFHTTHVYDGFLYVHSGAEKNTIDPLPSDYDTRRAVIKRFDLSQFSPGRPFAWDKGEVVVRGARNAVGFTRAASGVIYGVVNGIDELWYEGRDIHTDNPGDEVIRVEPGAAHGFPFCFTAQRVVKDGRVIPAGTRRHAETVSATSPMQRGAKDDAWCAQTTPPLSFVQAHSAPLDIAFFEGPDGALPARWKHGAFISLHGSWDRDPSTGYKIVWLHFDAEGRPSMPVSTAETTTFPYEVVFGGGRAGAPSDGAWGWSAGGEGEPVVRPVGVAVSPFDGALYVTSDNGPIPRLGTKNPPNGSIYRIGLRR